MPYASGAIDDLALAHHRDPLRAGFREVVQVHHALDHVHDLVARVGVKLAPVLAPARDEGDGIGRLPEDADWLDALADAFGDFGEADGLEFCHARAPTRA